ncbi:hypothetical protein DI487_02415 [Flavobacterium sediminis]|uniref:TonB C-terminal domain-containing protein n=1 Tax=Flavobacterium sediminis TaxID=2201181 RepID=A0A2U8QSL0_9FLAO|nr:energy transducer TonB [Flavobacterium sediminis]AWM12835.1 hypothetical protein DI487_02415 [Flavobacterium sediminis]
MKNIFYCIILFSFSCLAQNKDLSLETFSAYKVEQIPYTENCKNVTVEEQTNCLIEFLREHLKKNLQIPNEEFETLSMSRINVSFVITNEGDISGITVESPENTTFKDLFEKEIVRVLELAPKFYPGLQNNNAVNVFFKDIISCSLIKKENQETNQDIIIPYVNVNNLITEPTFKSCLDLSDDIFIQKECFEKQLNKYIIQHQIYPKEAKKNNISGKVIVSFVIEADGSISNLKSRGPENGQPLIDEAERLIKNIPNLVPGTINRKPIKVRYSKIITFNTY